MSPTARELRLAALVLLPCAALPLLSLWPDPGRALADPLSELPVKLWAFETFAEVGLLGGTVDSIRFPDPGVLNNPDPVGTVLTLFLRPLFGRVGAYDALVFVQLALTMFATFRLARELVRDAVSALLPAVAFALTPLVLVYCVTGAVTDMLNLWPYPLALRALLRALHREGWRDGFAAGAWAGLGFLSCPYNFVIFSAMAAPALLFVPVLWRRGVGPVETEAPPLRQLGRALAAAALPALLVGGGAAWEIRRITRSPDSMMSEEVIAGTRHSAPYPFLDPRHVDRYTAYLADYVAVGKGALIERSAGSRYYRAFSPGISLLLLAGLGGVLHRRRGMWLFWTLTAAWCFAASTGPFLPLTRVQAPGGAVNVAWLFCHHVLPGGDVILEPFRYALGGVLALVMAAAMGLDELVRRGGRWLGGAALGLWLVELVVVSPVPVPLPTADLRLDPGWSRLDTALGPGAVLSLPYFDRGTDRFRRIHFLEQRVHGRPIPDEVVGFPAAWLKENQFTADLLAREKSKGRLRVFLTAPDRVAADRQRFVEAGFAGVVVDPTGFQTPQEWAKVREALRALGEPTQVGGLYVWAAPAAPPPPAE